MSIEQIAYKSIWVKKRMLPIQESLIDQTLNQILDREIGVGYSGLMEQIKLNISYTILRNIDWLHCDLFLQAMVIMLQEEFKISRQVSIDLIANIINLFENDLARSPYWTKTNSEELFLLHLISALIVHKKEELYKLGYNGGFWKYIKNLTEGQGSDRRTLIVPSLKESLQKVLIKYAKEIREKPWFFYTIQLRLQMEPLLESLPFAEQGVVFFEKVLSSLAELGLQEKMKAKKWSLKLASMHEISENHVEKLNEVLCITQFIYFIDHGKNQEVCLTASGEKYTQELFYSRFKKEYLVPHSFKSLPTTWQIFLLGRLPKEYDEVLLAYLHQTIGIRPDLYEAFLGRYLKTSDCKFVVHFLIQVLQSKDLVAAKNHALKALLKFRDNPLVRQQIISVISSKVAGFGTSDIAKELPIDLINQLKNPIFVQKEQIEWKIAPNQN